MDITRVPPYFREHRSLVLFLSLVLIAGYGFELFSLNLTIDEEIHAHASQAREWIGQGRWGMYLLNRFLVPQPVVPFVPLFVALVFHLFAMLLLMETWSVPSRLEKLLIGSFGVAYPGIAYMYTFSTINYGIGIGLFLVALSVWLFDAGQGRQKYLGIVPGALAISVYQGMGLALVAAFLVYLLSSQQSRADGRAVKRDLPGVAVVCGASALLYYLVHKVILAASGARITYVDQFFDVGPHRRPIEAIAADMFKQSLDIYAGSDAIYGLSIGLLGLVVALALVGASYRLATSSIGMGEKALLAGLLALLVVLPFLPGLLMGQPVPMRSLVCLPVVFAGLLMLGLSGQPRRTLAIGCVLAGLCTLQFVTSTNALFSSSALALQADRLLASRLLERIAEAAGPAGVRDLKYLEVVGSPNRPATRLVPKSETFGASFFEWDGGNVYRIVYFLDTIEPTHLTAASPERRAGLVAQALSMPSWPAQGSVRVFGETAVVKFSAYSEPQKSAICAAQAAAGACNLK